MDRYAHSDGSRECRPVGSDPENEPALVPTGDLFDGTSAAPPRVKSRDELNSAQAASRDRLMTNPVALLHVNALRIEQVTKHGHSDETDAEERLDKMIARGRDRMNDAIDFARSGPANHQLAHRKLAIAAAIALAAMDWITNFQEQPEGTS